MWGAPWPQGARTLSDALVRPIAPQGLRIHDAGPIWSEVLAYPVHLDVAPGWVEVLLEVRAGAVEVVLRDAAGMVIDDAIVSATAQMQRVGLCIPAGRCPFQLVLRSASETALPLVADVLDVRVSAAAADPGLVSEDTLLVVYDCNRRPANYAAVMCLMAADIARRQRGLRAMHVALRPEGEAGARRLGADFRRVYPAAARHDFALRILPALARLQPSVESVEVVGDASALAALMASASYAQQMPGGTSVDPAVLHDFRLALGTEPDPAGAGRPRAADDDRTAIATWLSGVSGGRRVVTVTPRIERYDVGGNSNLAEWRAWAGQTDACVVLVGDPRDGAPPLPDGPWICAPESTPGATQALYELADANLAAYGERALPLLAGVAPFTIWVPTVPGGGMFDPRALRAVGLLADDQPALLAPGQSLVFSAPEASELAAAARG